MPRLADPNCLWFDATRRLWSFTLQHKLLVAHLGYVRIF
jgi:hypothetical protein